MNANSSQAFVEEEAKLNHREQLIMGALRGLGRAANDREIKDWLRYGDMNCVRPRITHLLDTGRLTYCGNTVCRVTGKTVRLVRVP
jgi:hypothetical protein